MKKIVFFSLLVSLLLIFVGCEVTTEPDESATLDVDSNPQGATIILDGNRTRLVTPAEIEIDPGTHQLRLELAGYQDYNETFTVQDGDTHYVSAQMDVAINTTINITTTPAGASIYIDGAYTGYSSPALIQGIEPGYHYIRLYYPGYNEVIYYVLIQENIPFDITETLSFPVPPYPVFDITYPYDQQHFDDNVIEVEGYIELDTGAAFTGDTAILSINGIDSEIDVDYYGYFDATISIASGQNDLQLRANGPNGDTGVSDMITVFGDFTAPEIEVVLWWNTPTADLDLHAWNPDGEHCYYGNPVISDGFLDIDDVEGYGPETFTVENASIGVYVIQINSYSLHADNYSDASVQVFFDGELEAAYGPHHFVVDDYNGSDPEAWWEVCTITVSNNRCTITNDEPTQIVKDKIEFDKLNLPRK